MLSGHGLQCQKHMVHTEEDTNLLTRYDENERKILDDIFESLRENERGNASDLIRDVSQVQILIHDAPEEAITRNPWQWESFGLRLTTFTKKGRWDWMLEQTQEQGWACKQLHAIQEEKTLSDGADGLDNRQQMQTRYIWETVTNAAEIRKALLIVLPSEVATYDPALGFLFRDDFPDYVPEAIYQSHYRKEDPKKEHYSSRETSYQDHIAGLVRAYYWNLQDSLAYVAL